MISRTKFIEQIETVQKFNKVVDQLQELNVDIVESSLYELPCLMFDNWAKSICTDEGQDMIFWWLYEDVPKIVWENEKEIDIDTIDDLYDYLKTNDLFT